MKEELEEDIKEEDLPPLPPLKKNSKPPILTRIQEAKLFKSLAHQSYKQAAMDNGLHLLFPGASPSKLNSIVSGIVKKITKAPEIWGLSQDTVDVVQEAMDSRSIKNNPRIRSDIAIQEESFRDKLDTMRDTVAEIITKKLKKYNKGQGHEDASIRDLKDLLAMAIDKSRLLRGESTENIIKMSKLDTDNLSPQDAMNVILKARDVLLENKR